MRDRPEEREDTSNSTKIPDLPDYTSVREAAKMIGCSPVRVYQYIRTGQLPAKKIGKLLILPINEVQRFRPTPSGRLRSKAPTWHIYHSHVQLSATIIQVHVRKGQQKQLLQKLDRKSVV